jgi:hypothetical protein
MPVALVVCLSLLIAELFVVENTAHAAEPPVDSAPVVDAPADPQPDAKVDAKVDADALEKQADVAPTPDPDPAPMPAPTTMPGAAPGTVAVPAPHAEELEQPQFDDAIGPACPAHNVCVRNDFMAVWPRLRLRTGYELVESDKALLNVGENDGFYLDQARLGVEGNYLDVLRFRLIFDAVSALPGTGRTDPIDTLFGSARDAWIAWTPSPFFRASVGQMFMPVDAEGGTTISGFNFTRRSVAVSGVLAGHGYKVAGLSPSRQAGIMISSDDDAVIGPVSISYAVAVSNGNGQNFRGNDNKLPAVYARIGAGYESLVQVGAGVSWNPRTVGVAPNLFDQTDATAFGDVRARLFGIDLLGQVIYRQTNFDTIVPFPSDDVAGSESALGVTAWVVLDEPFGLPFFGLKPGYRFSSYDPSSQFTDDQLLEHTISLRYDAPLSLPVSLIADYTFLNEVGPGVRDLTNNRLTFIAQIDL